jgi:hypothetical protein
MPRLLSSHLRTKLDNSFAEDWARQRRTADDILNRLQQQEGVVLADQVGMGKTYVALAVATTQILRTPKLDQVVVFVPARVAEKWVNEWGKFREALLVDAPEIRCVDQAIRSGEDFLKALDDPPATRNHLVVVSHEALTATLKDSFIQLALLYYATRNRREAATMRSRVAKWSDGAKGLIRDRRFSTERVEYLLGTPPEQWRDEWLHLTGEDLGDDPVPAHMRAVAQQLDLNAVWSVIRELPINWSQSLESRLKKARQKLNDATQAVWKQVLVTAKPRLPLLIVDEAHALKNNHTRISRLFTPIPDEPEDGALRGIFERMLLLTATPFELGHSELINVLSRLDAVRSMRPRPVEPLAERLERLKQTLRRAQETALALDQSWAHLVEDQIAAFDGWTTSGEPDTEVGAEARRAWRDASLAVRARKVMHDELRPWIIRHQRPHRRTYRTGSAILPNSENPQTSGLEIPEAAALPFLLAARAQAVAGEDRSGAARPLFAYGIASSYEAFLRLEAGDAIDTDTEDAESTNGSGVDVGPPSAAQWYHREITDLLRSGTQREQHPKIAATVERAADLWLSGQKCLIFCWYIRTTGALQDALRSRLDDIVATRVASALGVGANVADAEMERLSNRLLKGDSSNYLQIRGRLFEQFRSAAGGDSELADALASIAIRNLRTPAYLVRYTTLAPELDADGLLAGIAGANPTGVDLLTRWTTFVARMAAMTSSERTKVLARLHGEHATPEDDSAAGTRGSSLTPVRRAYGGTRREDRERLITVFNTPFAPDILVASSVMGEGIDLHQECRHVIHHDLDWNPSKLEQRTGRLDRIGALAEREQKNIEVYEPFLAGTHDEKMFRVVKDRAGWFDVVMGRATGTDEHDTDAEENRVPLHPRISEALSMNLTSR